MLFTLSLALLFTAAVGQECPGSFTSDDGSWQANWTVSDDYLYANFSVRARTDGWVGIGFSLDQLMPATDMVIGAVGANGMGYSVTDRYAFSRGIPTVDPYQNITNLGFERTVSGSETYTTMSFTRPICSNNDDDIALSEEPYILWAFGNVESDGTLVGHGMGDFGPTPMRYDFLCGVNEDSFTDIIAERSWQISWRVSPDASTAAFEVFADTSGWVGIGFSENNMMPMTDIVVGASNGGNMSYVSDRYANARAPPLVDTYQSLTYATAEETAAGTNVNFTRPTVNDDQQDVDLDDTPIYILVAWGTENNFDASDPMSIQRHNMTHRAILPNTYTFFRCGVIIVEPAEVAGTTAAPTATVSGSSAAVVISTTLMLILALIAMMNIYM